MNMCKASIVRLIPDPVQSEHVNLGVIVQDDAGNFEMEIPRSLGNTKVPRWFSSLDVTMLNQFLRELRESAEDHLSKGDLSALSEKYQMGIVTITPPRAFGMIGDVTAMVHKLAEDLVDLRAATGGGKIKSAGKVKRRFNQLLERAGLLYTFVEPDPKPFRPGPTSLPALMDYRWQNGTDQYARIYSADKSEASGAKAVENAIEDAKAVLMDCFEAKRANLGVHVLLQSPLHKKDARLVTTVEVMRSRLNTIGVPVFEADRPERLMDTIREHVGAELREE